MTFYKCSCIFVDGKSTLEQAHKINATQCPKLNKYHFRCLAIIHNTHSHYYLERTIIRHLCFAEILQVSKWIQRKKKKAMFSVLLFKFSNQLIHDLIDWKDFLWQNKRQYWIRWIICFQRIFQFFSNLLLVLCQMWKKNIWTTANKRMCTLFTSKNDLKIS